MSSKNFHTGHKTNTTNYTALDKNIPSSLSSLPTLEVPFSLASLNGETTLSYLFTPNAHFRVFQNLPNILFAPLITQDFCFIFMHRTSHAFHHHSVTPLIQPTGAPLSRRAQRGFECTSQLSKLCIF